MQVVQGTKADPSMRKLSKTDRSRRPLARHTPYFGDLQGILVWEKLLRKLLSPTKDVVGITDLAPSLSVLCVGVLLRADTWVNMLTD